MICVQLLRRFAGYSVFAALTAACGGSAVSGPGGEAGAGASAGSAGAGSAGAGPGSAGAGPGSAGAGPGSAGAGAAGGASSGACVYGGKSYPAGATFPASDGCNVCSCQNTGAVNCTAKACANDCSVIGADYASVLKKAKACDPSRGGQCTATALSNLPCGCTTPVNAQNQEALAQLASLKAQSEAACASACAPCEPPRPGTCSAGGSCEEAPLRARASCEIGGVVYASGTSGIPDPRSCNKCSCEDGLLGCTEINCPTPCPSGMEFGSQCAQCGPTDACQVVEYACLPTCTDSCMSGLCLNGICRQVCG
jgi:hypothetical protein